MQPLQPLGELGERSIVGRVPGCGPPGRGGVQDVVHALNRHQQQAFGAPAALPEEHDGVQRHGREHAHGELFARERRVGDGRLLAVRERRAHAAAGGVAPAGRAAGVERGVIAVLRDDAAEREEECRVVVAQADEVEQQLGIGGADDLSIVVGPLGADGPRAETRRTAAREDQEHARHREASEKWGLLPHGHRPGYWLKWARASRIGALERWSSPRKGRSISRIRKIAPATEKAQTNRAAIMVTCRGPKTPKLMKMTVSQNVRNTRKRVRIAPPLWTSRSHWVPARSALIWSALA